MGPMNRDWARLGQAVADARRALNLTQKELADQLGVSRGAIQAIERGDQFTKITQTMRAVERALDWEKGSLESVLDGGEPKPIEQRTVEPERAEAPAELAPQLPLAIVHELSAESGPVLDTTVLDLPGASPGSRMIVVIKGSPDASPEQIRKDLLAWSKEQRRLRGLTPDQDTSPGAHEA